MSKVFCIFGYGVPKNIIEDDNYRRYLSIVFNRIFDIAGGEKATILFCGGSTDCFKPYKRTEADEMSRLFKNLAKRKEVGGEAKKWEYILLNKTVCGLENILYTVGYLKKNRIKKTDVNVFCEQTRTRRIKTLLAYGKKYDKKLHQINFRILPVDFDLSSNRYLAKEFIAKREKHDTKQEFEAIKSQKALLKWRQWHLRKLEYLRKHSYDKNGSKVVENWWRENIGF
ncbi:MAG: hypothetical protein A2921_01850 [Candidatus Magasanikbacteria bacterium RIFCSPLOWO2_01_FULL_43_20b]|uniref:DUF218 domain-containing protein n=1 Tax=Candidatus Magasanikbacteria bacterium RIFCSPLOWO2_12_FULL_43_12 TaxID=1798692 RepID=A0A1F6MS30_9BACT|nr:MAG: hypothetical protein A3C74_00650 [Candidatus Magasanikbacteria bacterium RIFCSPHIGHO2_02_FULL_44_13]OGH72073.1 MAG: hypothetical protein A3I93_03715 [Candidatus Magasanikbacteria bacterium RIFCSPLOWO2_02_FULL_43_22]OGH73428.1 MAG: hypothetical protein A2921_01850 [Candidatus Magasanikbacteria bacterium RIFCSPLOWO2_01_FULL_43_20b]OGH74466.1 MAG: hypothetical protein A3G00_00210 [Candidatus Magasanikbacteria bacterium RIFCSPLOWO2_12_FULL_43_12]